MNHECAVINPIFWEAEFNFTFRTQAWLLPDPLKKKINQIEAVKVKHAKKLANTFSTALCDIYKTLQFSISTLLFLLNFFLTLFTLPFLPGELQYSPAVLQQRMAAELQYLESIEESVRQLDNMEKLMGVSMAQQESVSLAQMLKVQEVFVCNRSSNDVVL